ncbi:MAG TPA: MGMT family protein [bacterium]|nr:MGMT family protein [bacterium]
MTDVDKKSPLLKKIDGLRATSFQKRVWKALLTIPRGEVRTYAWVAQKIGRPQAVRAVGNAVGRNPLAPAVPCHRVVRTGWSPLKGRASLVGGYSGRGGIKTKLALLKKERARPPQRARSRNRSLLRS